MGKKEPTSKTKEGIWPIEKSTMRERWKGNKGISWKENETESLEANGENVVPLA